MKNSVADAKKFIKKLGSKKDKVNNVKKLPIIVDCDPGIDDALALIMLYENIEMFDLKLLCSCAGNTPIDVTTKNLQFFADNFFRGVKVAKGSNRALVKQSGISAANVHGDDGLGSYKIGHQKYPIEKDAVKAIVKTLKEADEPITYVALGPLTNLAKVVIMYPEVKQKIKVVYSMIGSIDGTGNIKPYSEFNSFYDPEAFDLVVKSGLKLVINPMQLGNETRVKKSEFSNMPTTTMKDNFVKTIASSINEVVDPTCVCLYDLNTIIALTNPEFYDFIPCDIFVETTRERSGQCLLIKNEKGKHCYQKAIDMNKLNKHILKTLFKEIN